MYKRVVTGLLLITVILGCSACRKVGERPSGEEIVTEQVFQGMCGQDYEIAYELAVQYPKILVNRAGYQTNADKTALFLTDELSDIYYIKESETNRIVYQGTMEPTDYRSSDGTPICFADFSDYCTEGTYRIENGTLGESYSFIIGDALCTQLLSEMIQDYTTWFKPAKTQDTVSIITQLSYLLMSYELYSSQYRDGVLDTYSKNEIPDILELIKKYADWFLDLQNGDLTLNERVCSAGFLANFSQIYNLYDNSYARKCSIQAESLMKLLTEEELQEADTGILYYAYVMNYVKTGYAKYRNPIHTILAERMEQGSTNGNENYILLGDLAYLTTKRSVQVEYCNTIMNSIMEHAEEASESSRQNALAVCGETQEEILGKVKYIIIANYVLESKEYRTLLENQFSFLQGKNNQSIVYTMEPEAVSSVIYLLLLNEMIQEYK